MTHFSHLKYTMTTNSMLQESVCPCSFPQTIGNLNEKQYASNCQMYVCMYVQQSDQIMWPTPPWLVSIMSKAILFRRATFLRPWILGETKMKTQPPLSTIPSILCVVRTFPHHGKSPSNPLKTLSMWNTHIFIIVSAICMEVSEVRSLIDDLSSQLSSWLHTMNWLQALSVQTRVSIFFFCLWCSV